MKKMMSTLLVFFIGFMSFSFSVDAFSNECFDINQDSCCELNEYDYFDFNNFSVEDRSAYSKNILTMDPLPITLRGDINLDVNITIIDATLLQKILARYSDINSDVFDELYYTGDTNSDGEIDVNDVTTIQKYLVKQIDILD